MKYAKPGWDKGTALHVAVPTKPAQQLENQYNKIQRSHLKKQNTQTLECTSSSVGKNLGSEHHF